jgi:uncharacterized membrane protein
MYLYFGLILLHLVGFAAFLGAGFAQQRLMQTSARPDLAPAVRNDRESLAATVCAKIELPAAFAQLASGILLLVSQPAYLKQHWLHGKLTFVIVLVALAHVEMANARKIVAARAAGGAGADSEIAALKKRHALLGTVGTVAMAAVLLFVTVLRSL